ncbi:MAG: lysylphosphatidylglycerol synthase domain-containing protein [Desulfocapsaceae bacterium]
MLKTDASLSIRRITTKTWKILLCAVGLILAWQALRGVAGSEVWHLLGKIDFRVIVFLTALNLLMLPLMNARWWLFLRMLDKRVGLLSLCAYRTAANTVSYLTPGPHFGGEPLSV